MRYTTRDDRGERVRARWRLLPPSGTGWRARMLDSIKRLEALLPIGLFVAGIAVLVTLTLREGPSVIAVTLFSPVSSSLIFVSISLLLWMNRALARHASLARDSMRREGRCPACWYDLSGLDADADQCTPCPECGAAWDLRHRTGTRTVVLGADGTVTRTPASP